MTQKKICHRKYVINRRNSHKKVIVFHKKVIVWSQKSHSFSSWYVVFQIVAKGEKGTKKYKKYL